jgi:chorismate mutase
MNALSRFDTQALNRALIGFDQLFNDVERRFANQVQTMLSNTMTITSKLKLLLPALIAKILPSKLTKIS